MLPRNVSEGRFFPIFASVISDRRFEYRLQNVL